MISNYYFMVLDIETSKHMEYDEKLCKEMPTAVWLSYGFCKMYDIKGNSLYSCYFREWEELRKFFYNMKFRFNKTQLICYVHNLSYEFDFLIKNLSKPKKFICNSSHNVISATLEEFPFINFRCTLQLTSKPLKTLGKELNFPKLDSDYRTILPTDEIFDYEIEYCERDCDIVAKQIVRELEEYGLLTKIPLTNTGRVRKIMKELLKEYPVPYEWDALPDENCYYAMVKAYKGAITMSNPQYTGRILNHKVICKDETSKYPGVMLSEKFPYTIKKIDNFDDETYKKYKFWIARVSIFDIYSKFQWGCLSVSTLENGKDFAHEHFNGKLIASPHIDFYLTNVDLEYIEKSYNFSSMKFTEFYACENYDYLPEAFYRLIEKFAKPKYELKKILKDMEQKGLSDTKEFFENELMYGKSKNMLNSIYGMMVQKLVQSEYAIDENYLWYEITQAYTKSDKHIGRNFLYGIFITAYSRRDLVLNIIHNCPNNFVYCDTDSIKYLDVTGLNGEDFIDLNKPIREDIRDLPYFKLFNRFDSEPSYDRFLTYGAKKYCYEIGGKFHYTVAGLPKISTAGKLFIDKMEDFKLGTTIKNCKLAKRFIYVNIINDCEIMDDFVRYSDTQKYSTINYLYENYIDTQGGVALVETDYTLNMTALDLHYLDYYKDIWKKTNII